MASDPMLPGEPWEWLRRHPLVYALLGGATTAFVALLSLQDGRGAVLAGLYGAAVVYIVWRPGGFGWRVIAHEQGIHDQGGPIVRARWLLGATFVVLAVGTCALGATVILFD